ncbi:MAG TPA: hypothetical protein ENN60_01355 [archaeon]|nr:hypothetical protein [archaeon]
MPIWRVTVNEVSARREKELPANMQVEVSPQLGKVEKEKAGEADLFRIPYTLNVAYGKDAGKISVGGNMFIIGEDASIFEKGNVNDPNVVRQIYQRIFVEPMVMAVVLAKELLLPLPVQMPQVKVEDARPSAKTANKK